MRRKVIAGNWKMNFTKTEALNFIKSIKDKINSNKYDVIICTNNIILEDMKNELQTTNIEVGSQNVYFEDKGAYTGEISAKMLKDIEIKYCIVGHSERRKIFNETNEEVNKKITKLIENNIKAIVCIGETLEERENETLYEVIFSQIKECLKNISVYDMINNIIIAYEPIWAIGTGVTATSNQAEDMCRFIREKIEEMYNKTVSDSIRIIYGGSVTGTNAKELITKENIDGALVGGASLKEDFIDIVNYNK